MERSDNELISDYLKGDDDAFETLVDRNINLVYGFVLRMCGNEEAANDLTQEVFLRVWKNIKKFDTEKNFKTWMFSIARNVVVDWYRKKKERPFSFFRGNEDDDVYDFESELVDVEPIPAEVYERAELAQTLNDALQKLGLNQRNAIIMHDFNQFTFDEIAELTKQSINTVKSNYRRGIIELRKFVAPKS